MRTVIYARKSSEREDRQVQSLEDQVRAMQALALREGLLVSDVIQEAHSAKDPGKRPEFEKLVRKIQKGQIDTILTWSINRLSRNPVDGGMIAHLLQTNRLVCIRTIDRVYRPEDNALLLSIENGLATAYIQDLRNNVKRGMLGKVERGWHTCKAPVGYKNHPETRRIVPDEKRFQLIRRAWELMIETNSTISQAHAKLVDWGLTVRVKGKTAQPISLGKVYKLFRDPFYKGQIVFKGEHFKGNHIPLVTEEEFALVQQRLNHAIVQRPQLYKPLPFVGLFRCAKCGCAIVGESKHKVLRSTGKAVTYTYYHCSGHRGCSSRSITETNLQRLASDLIFGIALPSDTQDWLLDALALSLESGSIGRSERASDIKVSLDRDERRARQLSYMRMDGEVSEGEHKRLRQEILERTAALHEEMHANRKEVEQVLYSAGRLLGTFVDLAALPPNDRTADLLGKVLQKLGSQELQIDPPQIRLHPVIEKITSFEPLRTESEKPKRGDHLPKFSVWWRLVEDLRTVLTDQIQENHGDGGEVSSPNERFPERRDFGCMSGADSTLGKRDGSDDSTA